MRSILFFHNNNDYTGSTRVLANVISSEYADKEVHIVVNKNHGRGFLSELPNVRMIGFGNLFAMVVRFLYCQL